MKKDLLPILLALLFMTSSGFSNAESYMQGQEVQEAIPLSPGNLANRVVSYPVACLGNAIYLASDQLRVNPRGEPIWNAAHDAFLRDISLYRLQTDGTRIDILYEGGNDKDTFPTFPNGLSFTVFGDWLHVSQDLKIRNEDMIMTPADEMHLRGFVSNNWEYELNFDNDDAHVYVNRYALDGKRMERLGSYEKGINTIVMDEVFHTDSDWIYIYRGRQETHNGGLVQSNDIIKIKADGTGDSEIHIISELGWTGLPQIVGGRIYTYGNIIRANSDVLSIAFSMDVDFQESRIAFLLLEASEITALHVTDDAVYYASVARKGGRNAKPSVSRIGHYGENPVRLAEMPSGKRVDSIQIADNWMLITLDLYESKGKPPIAYRMCLDGSGLTEWNASTASLSEGLTDATGKWRYRLLGDGSVMLLGAGAKLQLRGKLQIPSKVDKLNVTAIGEEAFYLSKGITGVTIPKSVTYLGNRAFSGCSGLLSVAIPEGVTHIGEEAFRWCGKLGKVSLPASLLSIGAQAFANCPALKLTVAKQNETFAVADGVLINLARGAAVQ